MSGAATAGAIALVAYLLWPTWQSRAARAPEVLPIAIGNTVFNVPAKAIRRKVQRRSGPQERVDLDFTYPSLDPPEPIHRTAAAAPEEATPQIDLIFLSIVAHHGATSPAERSATIYPRYLSETSETDDDLTVRAFREGTPYASEDLVVADGAASLVARCTRDASTPGMCLSERRIDDADLTFRFPRAWLAQWRDVAAALDQLTARLRSHHYRES